MRFGESLEWQQFEIADVVVGKQIGQQVVSMIVRTRRGRVRVAAGHDLERRIRRIAGEVFVGKHVEIRRMIDREQADLVEIDNFLHWLHQAEAVACRLSRAHAAIDFDVLRRTRNVALARSNPVSDDACADHVGDEFVVMCHPRQTALGRNCRGGRSPCSSAPCWRQFRFRLAGHRSATACERRRPALPGQGRW